MPLVHISHYTAMFCFHFSATSPFSPAHARSRSRATVLEFLVVFSLKSQQAWCVSPVFLLMDCQMTWVINQLLLAILGQVKASPLAFHLEDNWESLQPSNSPLSLDPTSFWVFPTQRPGVAQTAMNLLKCWTMKWEKRSRLYLTSWLNSSATLQPSAVTWAVVNSGWEPLVYISSLRWLLVLDYFGDPYHKKVVGLDNP